MRAYWTLTLRELAAFFFSLTGYIIIAAAVFLMGLSFVGILAPLRNQGTPVPVTQLFYATPYFWLILLLACPIITMRLFALEKFTGTFETLMTTPVSDLQVVLAKFTAAMVFHLVLWLPVIGCVLVVRHFATDQRAMDPPMIASAFLGVMLLGSVFMSLGCFASALTHSQIVAAMISFTLGFTLFLLSLLPGQLPASTPAWQVEALSRLALVDQMNDFASGLVDTRYVVFYLGVTTLFLFLTLRVVESRRWN